MSTANTQKKSQVEKLHQIEVIHRGPEGVISRLQSGMTTAELAGVALTGAKTMLDELGKDTGHASK